MRNACLDAALAALKEGGVSDYQISRGGRHLQLRWQANGATRFYSLPATPSDWRSAPNTRADVRRMLKNDGLITAPEPAERPSPPPKQPSLEQRVSKLEELVAQLRLAGSSRG
jgi:hypothetical protein